MGEKSEEIIKLSDLTYFIYKAPYTIWLTSIQSTHCNGELYVEIYVFDDLMFIYIKFAQTIWMEWDVNIRTVDMEKKVGDKWKCMVGKYK